MGVEDLEVVIHRDPKNSDRQADDLDPVAAGHLHILCRPGRARLEYAPRPTSP